jgi:DNA modification methylase
VPGVLAEVVVSIRVIQGDCRTILPTLSDGSVQCCVTSPPYFGLRDYGVDGQIGLEKSPDAYVAELVAVFREVRRVMRDDGTVWLNLGDSYNAYNGNRGASKGISAATNDAIPTLPTGAGLTCKTLANKQLLMIPARVALALQADGWFLRSAITWCKPAPMPESVTDRPTSATEQVFLLTKRATYFYNAEAIAEPAEPSSISRLAQDVGSQAGSMRANGGTKSNGPMRAVGGATRNARNWWVIAPARFSGAHFATMPPELIKRCIKAGSKPGDTILDPFGGAGTTGLVADRLGRNAVLIELKSAYSAMAANRVIDDAGLFAEVSS